MSDETTNCQYPRCNKESDIIYLGKGLCDTHWTIIAELDMTAAWKKLGIDRAKESKNDG